MRSASASRPRRSSSARSFELRVDPLDVLFVGDRLLDDIAGAAALGMTTAHALWFRADDESAAVEPDFLAFTPADVLTAVNRLAV